jgi:hypothetical protein
MMRTRVTLVSLGLLALLAAPALAQFLFQAANQALTTTSNPTFGNLTATGTIKSTAATELGWITQNATNQACNTTCTTGACVFGFNTAALGNLVSCTDASADSCLCAG